MKKSATIITVTGVFVFLFCLGNNLIAQSLKAGTQPWSSKNLAVTTFRNGESITYARTDAQWKACNTKSTPCWCYLDNNPANKDKYGLLYNWFAVNDPRGLAPLGWHVPTDAEWMILTNFLGGQDVAGFKLKTTSEWHNDGNGSNESGFSAYPCEYRYEFGHFGAQSTIGYWWTASLVPDTPTAWYRSLSYYDNIVVRYAAMKGFGMAVRCIEGESVKSGQ